MLTKPGANVISSTDGWEVEILGLTGMTYRDSTGTYAVDSEMLHGEPAFVVIRDALLWDGHEISLV